MESSREKFRYTMAKHPEIKPLFYDGVDLENLKSRISSSIKGNKICLVSPDKDLWRYQLSSLVLKEPVLHTTVVTTVQLLDLYLNNELSEVDDDVIVITDGRLQVPNRQKNLIVAQVFEQNRVVIYQYVGTVEQYSSDPYSVLDPALYDGTNLSQGGVNSSDKNHTVDTELF